MEYREWIDKRMEEMEIMKEKGLSDEDIRTLLIVAQLTNIAIMLDDGSY